MPEFQVYTIDVIILILSLAASRAVPIWLTRGKKAAEGYFLGGRNFIWTLVGFFLSGAYMSGSSFVGLAGDGYDQGISVYSYQWMAGAIPVLFILFILPFHPRSGGFAMPGSLVKRCDSRSRFAFRVCLPRSQGYQMIVVEQP